MEKGDWDITKIVTGMVFWFWIFGRMTDSIAERGWRSLWMESELRHGWRCQPDGNGILWGLAIRVGTSGVTFWGRHGIFRVIGAYMRNLVQNGQRGKEFF